MEKDNCYFWGRISKTHGLGGNLVAKLEADDIEQYEELESVFLEIQGKLVPFFISYIKLSGKNSAILKLDYIDNIDAAKELQGMAIYLPLSSLPELTEDEFYFHEIIGYQVVDEQAGLIGKIEDIIEYPKNQLFKIISAAGAEILVPIADEFIVGIDKEKEILSISAPEGLLDLNIGL
jgi:16S rRNA processing protein RimM